MDRLLEEPPSQEVVDRILDFYFQVRDFLNISELVDENYEIYTSEGEDGKFKIRLFCVNPASNLQECLNKGKSTVFFSATLLPMQYYRKLLSTREDDYGIYVRSPFDPEKRCILTCVDVSSDIPEEAMRNTAGSQNILQGWPGRKKAITWYSFLLISFLRM